MDANIVGLVIGVALAAITIFLIFWGSRKSNARIEARGQGVTKSSSPMSPVAATPLNQASVVPAPEKSDDLTLIEGIGPKINTILQRNGIRTFAQLAAADPAALVKILRENELPFAKPNSWPEQARLAAEGKMDELKALQEKLVAGR